MRGDAVFKRAYNRALAMVGAHAVGDGLASEHALARDLGVSRTTVRKILEALVAAGFVTAAEDGIRRVARLPDAGAPFPEDETEFAQDVVEKGFIDLIQREEIAPGQQINVSAVARELAVSPSAVREYLGNFIQFGLIARRPGGSWVFRGFDREFARELFDVRELFEIRAAELFGDLPLDHPGWQRLDEMERRHQALLAEFDARAGEFPALDRDFHTLVNSSMRNRFIDNFTVIRSLIFHYHYQWNKTDEATRNRNALLEHLDYMAALRSRDRATIRAAVTRHLRTARRTLMASMPAADGG